MRLDARTYAPAVVLTAAAAALIGLGWLVQTVGVAQEDEEAGDG